MGFAHRLRVVCAMVPLLCVVGLQVSPGSHGRRRLNRARAGSSACAVLCSGRGRDECGVCVKWVCEQHELLRGFGQALEGCRGNGYVSTLHVINSCIVKASKLTRVGKVYRGVSGGLLPQVSSLMHAARV